jgi:hypothetical protein
METSIMKAELVIAACAIAAVLVLNQEDNAIFSPRRKPVIERPTVNVPYKLRQGNWLGGRQRDGSCVHATMISLLQWQGRSDLASYWKRAHGGGEYPDSFRAKLEGADVDYVWCEKGDERFLEWAIQTRRGAGIRINEGRHMVALVDLTPKYAAILDNNDVSKFKWIDRAALVQNWMACGSWAFSPAYSPAAPLPPPPL